MDSMSALFLLFKFRTNFDRSVVSRLRQAGAVCCIALSGPVLAEHGCLTVCPFDHCDFVLKDQFTT
jgi:hypothetical protein